MGSNNESGVLFPYEEVRDVQKDMMDEIANCLKSGKSIIAHAPTGLGKTAAALAPTVAYALENKKIVFFLTSRHTQHRIALETLKNMREKHGRDFIVSDIIGKKHMCLQAGVATLYSGEFIEYCKSLREGGMCEPYSHVLSSGKLTVRARTLVNDLMIKGVTSCREMVEMCRSSPEEMCPYEISQQLAKEAKVIISDYYYIFNPVVQQGFFNKIGKDLRDCIIIVDEAHNLPERIRELLTSRLSLIMLERAMNEAKKMGKAESLHLLARVKEAVQDIAAMLGIDEDERLVAKRDFVERLGKTRGYDEIAKELKQVGDEIRKERKRSYIASVAEFLMGWKGDDEGFIRYVRIDAERGENIMLVYRCLDPGLVTRDIVKQAHSVIMMSGTLTPTYMYRDLIGFEKEKVVEKEYTSPFPEKNRLCMIIPETSTKFTSRSDSQYRRIAEIAAEAANAVKGNVALFFPSYYILNSVARHFRELYERTILTEDAKMSSAEKHSLIESFKKYEKHGASLLAASTGSFGEGIDLPGELLKAVIVVGLPLQKPDLETTELIKYYDLKFRRGWDYGYLFPAFNKTLQNAGRCIRTESDRGVIIFLDERYAWKNYFRCFPSEMKLKITRDYKAEIVEFFWN